ncbi:outer membrane immunogenic protein [Parasphingopyxis lamellibrachiae]|uniref:Outer membrane immunogenic protein n=2 Tax=Parasphingopyxis lamellibrachiae TaxID=680125 RepID=A0A3D9FJ35_9SPHN|nr:outer membrane immunogenic protein [Parasphingopyxis lamellibrachiae]
MKHYHAITAAIIVASGLGVTAAHAEEFVGPRVEATIGWNQLQFDLRNPQTSENETNSELGWGFAAGYDVPIGSNLIAGVEAGISFSDDEYSFEDGSVTRSYDGSRDIALMGRLGTRIGNNALGYLAAGYSNYRTDEFVENGGILTSETVNLDGLRLGAGLEVALTPSTYLKSEYRHTIYEDDISRNEILTGIGFRF